MESGYDDYCVAQMARALNKTEDEHFFMKRAGFYKNLYDRSGCWCGAAIRKENWRTPLIHMLSPANQKEAIIPKGMPGSGPGMCNTTRRTDQPVWIERGFCAKARFPVFH
jgi:hypothetical protein